MDPYRLRRFSAARLDSEVELAARAQAPAEPATIPHVAPAPTVRYAEWRAEPAAPLGPWRAAFRDIPLAAWLAYPVLCASLLIAGWPAAGGALQVWAWTALPLSAMVILASVMLREYTRSQARTERLERMRDYGAVPQFLVTARFFRGREVFDADHGLVSVIDGSLYFVGENTSFSFSPRAARLTHGFLRAQRFEYARHGKEFSLEFSHESDSTSNPRLRNELRRFLNSRIVDAAAVDVLPPACPSPAAAARARVQEIHSGIKNAALLLVVNLYGLSEWFRPEPNARRMAIFLLIISVTAFCVAVKSARSLCARQVRMGLDLAENDGRGVLQG